jgi:hypothetical protein
MNALINARLVSAEASGARPQIGVRNQRKYHRQSRK